MTPLGTETRDTASEPERKLAPYSASRYIAATIWPAGVSLEAIALVLTSDSIEELVVTIFVLRTFLISNVFLPVAVHEDVLNCCLIPAILAGTSVLVATIEL
jgi:hypothetical protein